MKKVLAVAALATIAVVGIGASDPAEGHAHQVSAKVCRNAWQHPTSHTVNQCRKQGWMIEVDYDGLDNLWQVLVVGPHGHVWVDNLGTIETR